MGLIALPEMLKRGYDESLACGPVLAGGCLGPIIPPSTIMIIMASYTGVSAGWLFMGGVLPGILLAIAFIIYIGIRCAISPKLGPAIPADERPTWGEKFKVFNKIFIPIGIIVLVLGCIYRGIATPTEAAGVGAFASMIYSICSRRLSFKNLKMSLIQTMTVSVMLMWILMGGAAYNSLVNITRFSGVVATALSERQSGWYRPHAPHCGPVLHYGHVPGYNPHYHDRRADLAAHHPGFLAGRQRDHSDPQHYTMPRHDYTPFRHQHVLPAWRSSAKAST